MAFPKLIFERYRRVADLDPGVLLVGLDFPLKDETGLIGGWRFGFRCRWFHALFVVRVAERTDGGLAGGKHRDRCRIAAAFLPPAEMEGRLYLAALA